MATHLSDPERRVVPRWRSTADTIALGEARSLDGDGRPVRVAPEELAALHEDWEANKTVPFAADLVAAAFIAGERELACNAAEYLINHGDTAPLAQHVARALLNDAHVNPGGSGIQSVESTSAQRIHRLRHNLRKGPRDPLGWIDLAREHASAGQGKASEKAVRVALALAPENRFILRSAARFFLHDEQRDRAHDLLRRANAVRHDPWLLSAEIATASAAGKTSGLIRTGQQMLEARRFSPHHLSELASALGTLEMQHGSRRRVRRLFDKALEQPTENSIAQWQWVSRKVPQIDFHPDVLKRAPRSFEASAWEYLTEQDFEEAVVQADQWRGDEPFSSRPAVLGSFLRATALGDFQGSTAVAQSGLIANPDDPVLLNNVAFALASDGDLTGAARYLARIDKEGLAFDERPMVLATKGLLHFRLNDPEQGREYYRKAIDMAERHSLWEQAMWGSLFFAREEARLGGDSADLLGSVDDLLKRLPGRTKGLAEAAIERHLGALRR